MIKLDSNDTRDDIEWTPEMLREKVEFGSSLSTERRDVAYNMLMQSSGALSQGDGDLGKARVTPHVI
jgi:hypothetical protein